MELGGKSPAVVFADADLEATEVLGLDGSPQPVSDAVLDESAVQIGADGLG
jgi:hypothetical protein